MEEIKKSVLGGEKMKKVIYIVGMIALIAVIIVMPAAAAFEPGECDITVCASGCDYSSMEVAVESATDGQTVCVYNGTYGGAISINTPNVTVKGEGADVVTWDGGSENKISLGPISDASGCILEGFTIKGAVAGSDFVKPLAPNCIIRNCVFEGLTSSYGVLVSASNTTFENNVFVNCTGVGSLTLPPNGSKVINNTFINNGGGILLYGALLATAPNGTITRNNIISNTGKGFWLYNAGPDNKIYLNNIVDNDVSVAYLGTPPPTIYWNSTEQIEYVCPTDGKTYTGYLGNYWSDHPGGAEDGCGIWATPYGIPPDSPIDYDYHPLMASFENYPAPAVPPTPPTPFLIHGWVNYSNGTAVLGPNVTITNLNTSEVFTATTSPASNYYQVSTTSCNISAGNVLHFNASNGGTAEFDHTVTQAEMNAGGFELNITIQRGICGDVNDDGSVNTMDGMIVFKHYFHPEQYPLSSEWAADVNCDGSITTMDGMIIFKHYFHPEEYPLNCC